VSTAQEPTGETTVGEEAATEPAATGPAPETAAEAAAEPAETAPAKAETKPAKKEPRPLPPGWFRATPQMMSLVGCSEPEMADVLRALGYRVHPPSEENGPLYAFSIKPRFVREREEQRERQRLQERERNQRRRERPERPNERQFFADSPRPPKGRDDGPRSGSRPGGGHAGNGPRPEGQKQERKDGRPPQDNRGRDDRRGPRPPRRDSGGPALRLYASTETKGEQAADSPFAKLLELKLGGKK
jgi:ATP-dependent RNA helicase SUPV3L1/SUV3